MSMLFNGDVDRARLRSAPCSSGQRRRHAGDRPTPPVSVETLPVEPPLRSDVPRSPLFELFQQNATRRIPQRGFFGSDDGLPSGPSLTTDELFRLRAEILVNGTPNARFALQNPDSQLHRDLMAELEARYALASSDDLEAALTPPQNQLILALEGLQTLGLLDESTLARALRATDEAAFHTAILRENESHAYRASVLALAAPRVVARAGMRQLGALFDFAQHSEAGLGDFATALAHLGTAEYTYSDDVLAGVGLPYEGRSSTFRADQDIADRLLDRDWSGDNTQLLSTLGAARPSPSTSDGMFAALVLAALQPNRSQDELRALQELAENLDDAAWESLPPALATALVHGVIRSPQNALGYATVARSYDPDTPPLEGASLALFIRAGGDPNEASRYANQWRSSILSRARSAVGAYADAVTVTHPPPFAIRLLNATPGDGMLDEGFDAERYFRENLGFSIEAHRNLTAIFSDMGIDADRSIPQARLQNVLATVDAVQDEPRAVQAAVVTLALAERDDEARRALHQALETEDSVLEAVDRWLGAYSDPGSIDVEASHWQALPVSARHALAQNVEGASPLIVSSLGRLARAEWFASTEPANHYRAVRLTAAIARLSEEGGRDPIVGAQGQVFPAQQTMATHLLEGFLDGGATIKELEYAAGRARPFTGEIWLDDDLFDVGAVLDPQSLFRAVQVQAHEFSHVRNGDSALPSYRYFAEEYRANFIGSLVAHGRTPTRRERFMSARGLLLPADRNRAYQLIVLALLSTSPGGNTPSADAQEIVEAFNAYLIEPLDPTDPGTPDRLLEILREETFVLRDPDGPAHLLAINAEDNLTLAATD
ncbi:MAG: hypothetical protein AAF654_13930 [Myxococcota bacterium]